MPRAITKRRTLTYDACDGSSSEEIPFSEGPPSPWGYQMKNSFCVKIKLNHQFIVDWKGSYFPSHYAYIDKQKVGSRTQSQLGAFMYRTAGARTIGVQFHNASGSGITVNRP
jgi:hypothetical protein